MTSASPSTDARRTVQGPSRRTVARGAAWTLPVVAIASAAPTASASPVDHCKPCADTSKLLYKGANIPTMSESPAGTAWFDHNHSDDHVASIDINLQIGSACVTATSGGAAYTAVVSGSGGTKTSPVLQASFSGWTIHTSAAAAVGGSSVSLPATDGLSWNNGEHISLHSGFTNGVLKHTDNAAVAYVTATLTIGACKYLVTITPSVPVPADHHGPIASVSFAPIA